jgi:hypothetical protein
MIWSTSPSILIVSTTYLIWSGAVVNGIHSTSASITIDSSTPAISGAVGGANKHIGNCYAYYKGMHLLGSVKDSTIYQLSSSYYTDDGVPIYSTRISDVMLNKETSENIFLHRLFVDAEVGEWPYLWVTAPDAFLAVSKDNGYTWSADYPASMGHLGSRLTRLLWRRLGYGTTLTAKLTMSGTIRKILVNAYGEVGV